MSNIVIDEIELENLRSGKPPLDRALLAEMTLGEEHWLDRFKEHYLYNYLAQGGSKVKVLVGRAGSGKTHLLRCVEQDARDLGYEVVYLSAPEMGKRLNDLPNLYRVMVEKIDKEKIIKGLCCRVARDLGYYQEHYDGSQPLLPILVEKECHPVSEAKRLIRQAVGNTFRALDAGPSFVAFCYNVVTSRMVTGNINTLNVAVKWLCGHNLERHEKKTTGLYERLQKSNARAWLNSLVQILKMAEMTGLVLMIDNLEIMTERLPNTKRFAYTRNAVKDTCELIRQFIDDGELLPGFLLILAGRREIIEDEMRGLKSYDALWMRLQTGLIPSKEFNPYCDIVDVDAHLRVNGPDFPGKVAERLNQIFRTAGYKRKYKELPDLNLHSKLRAQVMENALLVEKEATDYE